MSITGKQILQAVKKYGGINPNWATAQQQVMEHYLEHELPDALRNLLDQPATAELIVQAQLEHNRRFLSAGMPRQMLTASLPGDPMLSQRIAAVEKVIQDVVDVLTDVLQDFNGLLRQNNMQEQDYLLTLPLAAGFTQLILQRRITVGDLLLDQPKIILGFSAN